MSWVQVSVDIPYQWRRRLLASTLALAAAFAGAVAPSGWLGALGAALFVLPLGMGVGIRLHQVDLARQEADQPLRKQLAVARARSLQPGSDERVAALQDELAARRRRRRWHPFDLNR